MPDRDLIGYGATPPKVSWPNDASIAISLLVNYEEGSENLLQDGVGRREMAMLASFGQETLGGVAP